MSFHEVPEDFDPLDVSVAEGVVVCPVAVALHHLLALVAAAPHLAVEPVAAVHVGGVDRAGGVAVHVLDDLGQVFHLDVVVPAVIGDHSSVRTNNVNNREQ